MGYIFLPLKDASIFIFGLFRKKSRSIYHIFYGFWNRDFWAFRTGARFWPKPLWDDAKGGSFWEGEPFEVFFRSEEVVWKNKVLKLEKVFVCENCSMSIYHFISFYIILYYVNVWYNVCIYIYTIPSTTSQQRAQYQRSTCRTSQHFQLTGDRSTKNVPSPPLQTHESWHRRFTPEGRMGADST